MASGVQVTASLAGTEYVDIDGPGSVKMQALVQTLGNMWGKGAVIEQSAVTVSAQNSSTLTLSQTVAFTAVVLTQTSTGITVNLPTSPVDKQVARVSFTGIVTNLTVTAPAGTVLNGAVGAVAAGAVYGWIYFATGTSWYKWG